MGPVYIRAVSNTGVRPCDCASASASLTLRGIGADNLAVAEFVVGLREAGVFERVDLKSAAESESTRSHTTVYQVECGF